MGTASESQASSFKIHPNFIMPSQSPVTVYRDATLVSEYLSQIFEGGLPSERDMVIFFKRLSETCGVDILEQIHFVMEHILQALKSTTAGDSDQRGCVELISCVSKFVIHYLIEKRKRKERLRALCTPLAKGLLGTKYLAKGCVRCLEVLVGSEWWTDAETVTILGVFDEIIVKPEDKSILISVLHKLKLKPQSPREFLLGSKFSYESFWAKRELLSKFGPPGKDDLETYVKVIIRIRPLTREEKIAQGQKKCVRHVYSQAITWTGHPETSFYFDHVADENATQERLFRVDGYSIVKRLMGGYNCCVFAYGQAGSGKTHTMLGDIYDGTPQHSVDWGMIPRLFERLFSRIEKEKESRREEKLNFTCKCWCVEIYNDQMIDMWNHSAPRELQIRVRDDVEKGVIIENLTELEVRNVGDIIKELVQGSAATNMNCAISSSHRVLTCSIEGEWVSEGVTHRTVARLHLVDLAASERLVSSDAEGGLQEAMNIKSHSTLGPVIMKLVSLYNGKSLDRDVKLSRLLQDSLGSKSRTTVVATISPSFSCSSETLSTLKFGEQAKLVKNNRCVAEADVLRYEAEVLRSEGGDPGEEQETIVPFHSIDCMGVPSTQQVSVRQFQDFRDLIHFARVAVYGEGALKCGTPQVTFFDRNGDEKYASVILPYEDFKPTAIFAIPMELKYFPLAP